MLEFSCTPSVVASLLCLRVHSLLLTCFLYTYCNYRHLQVIRVVASLQRLRLLYLPSSTSRHSSILQCHNQSLMFIKTLSQGVCGCDLKNTQTHTPIHTHLNLRSVLEQHLHIFSSHCIPCCNPPECYVKHDLEIL